jgi:hypothetical protein
MDTITEGIMDFKTLEQTIFGHMCQVACLMARLYLQTWDKIIMARRDTKEYRFVGYRPGKIKTVMGEVAYERAYYRKKSGGYAFLLDEGMGISGGYGNVSENLGERIAAECMDKSFRKAAGSISSLTGQRISAMGAWNVMRQLGERISAQVERLKELDAKGATGQMGNVGCPVLFTEYDDVWINMQRAERRKAGAPAEKGRKRIGARPMHVGTAYTGWEQEKGGRFSTADKFAYASTGDAAGFTADFEALLRHRYDMDGVQRRLMNGDGEGWIKTSAEECDAVLQLDPFHRGQAVQRAVSGKDDRKKLDEAFAEKDVDKALDVLRGILARTSDEEARKKLEKLLSYFENNKDSLLPWQDRGISIPEPPEGIVYRNMGVQESSNGTIITHRMKHERGSWSTEGASNMAKALCFRDTIGLGLVLGALPDAPAGGLPADVLSAAKAPVYDGNGHDGTWLRAALPLEEAFMTSGREAIRNLVRQRPISELSFI